MHKRQLISTEDGSATIYLPEWDESYHSKHGAVREALHVFIKNGFAKINAKDEVSILEIGFGTGLNALISLVENFAKKQSILYTGLEKYPVNEQEFALLNYPETIKSNIENLPVSTEECGKLYKRLMTADWEDFQTINPNFRLRKINTDFLAFDYPADTFDLVYFDAFGAKVQPELWTEELFSKIHYSMKTGGLLTTYSSKGSVRRSLINLGFEVEKLAGPPGKREMINAVKK